MQDWDSELIAMHRRIPEHEREKSIITAYPASYGDAPEEQQANQEINTRPPRITTICRTRRVQVGRTVQFKVRLKPRPRFEWKHIRCTLSSWPQLEPIHLFSPSLTN